jgi:hypothetical protein
MTSNQKTDTTTFTCTGKETTFITNLFKKTELRITLRSSKILQKQLMPKLQTLDKCSSCGAYKLTFPDCNKAYVGQAGRSFTQRLKKKKNAFRSNRNTSNYAKHALEHSQPFGPIHETMQILQYQGKGAHLNTIEIYFTCKEFSSNNHLNYEFNITPNKIFDDLLKLH